MEREPHRYSKSLIWGLCLVALGSAFLLDELHMISLPNLGRLWPLIFVVIGITRVASGLIGSSLTFFALGAWFLACEFGWYGLTYQNSWPLILIALGAGMVVKAITGEGRRKWTSGGGAS